MTALIKGQVITHLGKGLAVETNGQMLLCHTRRRLAKAAVGDQVLLQQSAPTQGCVEEILPRRSILMRPARNGKTRPVAANIDQVFVVFAPQPAGDFLLIDQYLAVCENHKITAHLLLNKTDLDISAQMFNELEVYQALGYSLFKVSVKLPQGLAALQQAMQNKTSILSGQSGVGKSSLSNAFIPDKTLAINSLSAGNNHGRHTTTTATLYHLPAGGDLIDSPGVAIFGLAGLSEQQLAYGFREFQTLIAQCRFNDCRHVKDKDCAIRHAVADGRISANRYQRFLKLRDKMPAHTD